MLKTEKLKKKYRLGREIISAVDGVDLDISSGEFLAIVGKSGSGKSTLLNLLAGLERPTSGSVWIDGMKINSIREKDSAGFRRDKMGFIFQSYNLLPQLTALENVMLPLVFRGMSVAERERKAREMLEKVGLKERMLNKPGQMSGGQQQRVSIARALIGSPEIVFADEPTGNLDSRTTEEILGLLEKIIREKNRTLIMVTHDRESTLYADRVIHMMDGRIIREEVRESVQ